MEPNSPVLLVLVFLAVGGALYALVRYRQLAIRIAAGTVATALAVTAGMFLVNDYYGYYQSWSQLSADLSGSYGAFNTQIASDRIVERIGNGQVQAINLPGKQSHINRVGLVYLPPQYFDPRYAHTQFPAIELLHGTPGNPSSWLVHLHIASVMDQLIAKRLVGPMILVMPTMSVGRSFQECVDAPGALDDTYITQDVRSDIQAKYRVSTVGAEWGIAGYSSGGYCAANLALRHPTEFGASGIMDGYFRPQDGPAANALHFNPAAEAANDPLRTAALLAADSSPVPSFFLSTGTGDHADVAGARAFVTALHSVESVAQYDIPGAGHDVYAWQPAVPYLLQWMWTQLAEPQLRVQFPIAGSVRSTTINLPADVRAAAQPDTHRPPPAPVRHSARPATRPKVPAQVPATR
jgi:enterochelin esterase-like enzyme